MYNIITIESTAHIAVTSKPRKFFYKLEGTRRRKYRRTYSETVQVHKGACCESNALLWLRNMGQRPDYNAFFQEQCDRRPFRVKELILLTRD